MISSVAYPSPPLPRCRSEKEVAAQPTVVVSSPPADQSAEHVSSLLSSLLTDDFVESAAAVRSYVFSCVPWSSSSSSPSSSFSSSYIPGGSGYGRGGGGRGGTGTVGTPLHAFCQDRDGQRGEEKIRLLLQAASAVGIDLREVASARLSRRYGCGGGGEGLDGGYGAGVDFEGRIVGSQGGRKRQYGGESGWGDTPLHCLCSNDAATDGSLGLVLDAWPGAVYAGRSYGLTPLSDLCYGCLVKSGKGVERKIMAMLEAADSAAGEEGGGVHRLVHQRDQTRGETPLHSAVRSLRWAAERSSELSPRKKNHFGKSSESVTMTESTRSVIIRLLLQACPSSVSVRDGDGNNPLHCAVYFGERFFGGDKNFTLELFKCVTNNVPLEYLVEALGTANGTAPLYRPSPELMGRGMIMEVAGTGKAMGGLTPVCLVRKKELRSVETYLTKLAAEDRIDGRGWTLLHHAAAARDRNQGEVKKKSKTRATATAKVVGSREEAVGEGHEEGRRQGMASLINWLVSVSPRSGTTGDDRGRLPLHLAATAGLSWDSGTGSIARCNPEAMTLPDPTTGLYPFMSAAASLAPNAEEVEAEVDTLDASYQILKSAPHVLSFFQTRK